MGKNLLDKETSEVLVQRVQKLRAATSPLWGKMTATEMLLHVNKVHQHLLSPPDAAPAHQKTSAKQLLIRWLVLYLLPRYPKGAKTPHQLNTKGAINNAAFEEQKRLFIALLRRLAHHKEPINHYHPYFGALSTRQWGLSSWKHADHHLRQFGL
jgi:hypothetical protein